MHGDKKQRKRAGHGDCRVREHRDGFGEHGLKNPSERREHEDDCDGPFAPTEATERPFFLRDQIGHAGEFFGAEFEAHAREHPINDRQGDERDRDTDHHPLAKTNIETVDVAKVTGEKRVGRRADQSGHTAGGRAVGHGEEQRDAEGLHVGALAKMLGEQLHDRGGDGQHHERGGGVAHPHTDEGGGEKKPRDNTGGFGSERSNQADGDTAVEVPTLHRKSDDEAAKKQEDDGVGVGRCGRFDVTHSESRKQHERKQRGSGNRNGFADPKGRHQ